MPDTRPITIEITGQPVPWARSDGHGKRRFTPDSMRKWQDDARIFARLAMKGRVPLDCPIELSYEAVFPVSKSWPTWKRDMAFKGLLAHTKVPDKDNLEKCLKDAFNKIVWLDDSYVCRGDAKKSFGLRPGVKAIIKPLRLVPCQVTNRLEAGKFLHDR